LIEKSVLLENKDPIINILIIGDQILIENNKTNNKYLNNESASFQEFSNRIIFEEITDRE
jgi:hypothetical protein